MDSENENRREAIGKKLHVWTNWRTDLNDAFISDMFRERSHPVAPLDDVIKKPSPYDHPDPERRENNPLSLMAYSANDTSVTDLNPEEFLSYGIPRASAQRTKDSTTSSQSPPVTGAQYANYDTKNEQYANYPLRCDHFPTRQEEVGLQRDYGMNHYSSELPTRPTKHQPKVRQPQHGITAVPPVGQSQHYSEHITFERSDGRKLPRTRVK